jgi:hypothetical protein
MREKRNKESGEVVRHYTGGKVPRQCPLVLLVQAMHMTGTIFMASL